MQAYIVLSLMPQHFVGKHNFRMVQHIYSACINTPDINSLQTSLCVYADAPHELVNCSGRRRLQ